MDINRTDLIRQLAERNGCTIKLATKLFDDLVAIILDNIRSGNSVSIYGFGCFDLLKRKAHVCPNRQLGTMVDVPAHYIPRFYPGVRMHTAVKDWERSIKGDDE